MNWKTVKLGDVCKTSSGGTPKRDVTNYYNGDIPWVKSGELKDSLITKTGEHISKLGLDNSSAKLIPKGTLLIALYGATVGKLGILDIEAASNQAVCAIYPSKAVHQKYLFHYLFKIRNKLIERRSGGAQPNISQDIIRNLQIPLPPLPEQKRIAEVLDKADALREKRRRALQKLDTLLQSVFLEMFGDPMKNPKGLEKSRFGDIFKRVRYGTGSPPPYIASGNPFIRATNIKTGTVIMKDLKFISDEDAKKIEKCRVSYGDLIVVRSGVNSGDCAMIPKQFDGAFAAYDLIVELELNDAIFYNYLVNSEFGKQTIGKLTRRAAQPHLNAEQLSSIEFIRPNPAEIKNFVLFYQKVEELKGKSNVELSNLENLFQSLQQRAFKGELFSDESLTVNPQEEKSWRQTSLF